MICLRAKRGGDAHRKLRTYTREVCVSGHELPTKELCIDMEACNKFDTARTYSVPFQTENFCILKKKTGAKDRSLKHYLLQGT